MKLRILLILIAVFGGSGCATKPEPASLNEVIESPDSFDGKPIIVEGVAYFDVETSLICSAPDDLLQCIWVKTRWNHEELKSKFQIETGSKIIVSGTFMLRDIKSQKNTIKNGVMYIRRGPYWHLLQEAQLKKL